MERGPSLLPALRSACGFVRKQPILLDITLWLVVVPGAIADAVIGAFARSGWQTSLSAGGDRNAAPAVLMLFLVVGLCGLWAQASTLIVARRMLKRSAGRSRTSLQAVTREARGYVMPLLLTEILWTSSAILWGLLLVVPGLIAAVRGMLFPVIMVTTQGPGYREALRRSAAFLQGKLLQAGLTMLAAGALCLGIPFAIKLAIDGYTEAAPEVVAITGSILAHGIAGVGQLVFWLALVACYVQIAASTDGQPRTANTKRR